jgi:general secretion pathway protein I
MTSPDADRGRLSSASTRGFTLIEVLAALVIVALGMLGVIQAVTQTARNGTYLREKTLAHWIAMNVITEQRLQPTPPEVAETSDEVEFAGQRWRWTNNVTQTQVESLRRMDVSVRRADQPEGQALTTVTGFYGTAIGAAGGAMLPWAGAPGSGNQGDGEDGADEADGDGDDTPAQDAGQRPRPRPERNDQNDEEEE